LVSATLPRAVSASFSGGEFGESAGLEQQRPGEGRDRFFGVEVAAAERFRDRFDGRRGGAECLLAAPQPARRAELKHRFQVGLRLVLGRAYLMLVTLVVVADHRGPVPRT
jgi:hypothetical protein